MRNVELFAKITQSEVRSCGFMSELITVSGQYQDHFVYLLIDLEPQSFRTINPNIEKKFLNQNRYDLNIEMLLFVEPNQSKKESPDWKKGFGNRVHGITDKTGFYTDGRIYYDYLDISDPKIKFVGKISLDPIKDRKSLFAFFHLDLTEKDVLFFLDELIDSVKIHR